MKRIDTPSAENITAGGKTFKGFTKGDAIKRQEATHLSDDWCNNVQEEICSVIEENDGTVNTGNAENYTQLTAAIGKKIEKHRGRTFNHVGEIIEHNRALSERYLVENRLVKCDGQALNKSDYPDLYDAVVDKYNFDKNDVSKLSLAQSIRYVPRVDGQYVIMPVNAHSRHSSQHGEPSNLTFSTCGVQGTYSAGVLPNGVISDANRTNLIYYNPYVDRIAFIKDSTSSGATLVEVDPKNWTSTSGERVITTGIGGVGREWKHLFYDSATNQYQLYFKDISYMKYFVINRLSGVFSLSTHYFGPQSASKWLFSDGVDNINLTRSGMIEFGVSYNRYYRFEWKREPNDDTNVNANKWRARPYQFNNVFGADLIFYDSYLNSSSDLIHYFHLTDTDNWLLGAYDTTDGWYLLSTIQGYRRWSGSNNNIRIIGTAENDDAYFFLQLDNVGLCSLKAISKEKDFGKTRYIQT